MGRGSTQLLVKKIIETLAKSPKSISEIADATGLDRTAISKYLGILTESGLLIEEQEGTSKRFTIVPTYRTDTYFGLPLDQSAEKQMNSVYHLIREEWKSTTSKRLLSTNAQKIAYKVIASCDELSIPAGWYMYGGISVVAYDDSREYAYYDLPAKVKSCVKEVTAEYAKNEYAWQSKKNQYEEADKELYTTKEDILSILYSPQFDEHPKNSLFILVKKIRKLVSLAPKASQPKFSEVLEAYEDLMLDVTNKLDDKTVLAHKRDIIVIFEAVWKYIALFNFQQDLRKYYSQKILDMHFKLDVQQQEDEIVELGTELQSLIPEDEVTDSIEKKLREALSQIRLLGPEEQKRQKEKLERMEKELGHEKFQEYLLEQVGLK